MGEGDATRHPAVERLAADVERSIKVLQVMSVHLEELGRAFSRHTTAHDDEVAGLRRVAETLSEASVRMVTARALWTAIPNSARLAALGLGACVGSFAATLVWLMLTARPAVAALVGR